MALISCPGCGENISDKARVCPKCGYIQEATAEKEIDRSRTCDECGAVVKSGVEECPNCGNPLSSKQDTLQKVEVTRIRIPQINKRAKKIIGMALGATVLAVVAIITIISLNNKRNAQQAAEDYAKNLDLITYGMLSGAADAETAGNLIHDVWYNSIYQESDPSTDEYTRSKFGGYNDDFNTSLGKLFSDSSFTSQIEALESNQAVINELMKQLANPPEEFKEAYAVLKDYYNAYYELTTLVISPKGSLQTFTDKFNEADSEVLKYYNAMELYLD